MSEFDSVLIRPRVGEINSRSDVETRRTFPFGCFCPIIASNMHQIGTPKMAEAMTAANMMCTISKFVDVNPNRLKPGQFMTFGTNAADLDKLFSFLPQIKFLCLDIANGYIPHLRETVSRVKKINPFVTLMAGNVATWEGAGLLWEAGADIVKVGIGPGLACTTRQTTGVGVDQLTALKEIWAHRKTQFKCGSKFICLDGGMRTTGDICKALYMGADFVMIGSMLAGTDESGTVDWEHVGMYINSNNDVFKCPTPTLLPLYGMASSKGREELGLDDKYTAEGTTVVDFPYRGEAKKTLADIDGAIRSCCTYTNCESVRKLTGLYYDC